MPSRPCKLRGRRKPSDDTSEKTDDIQMVPAAPKDNKLHWAASSERALILKTNMFVFPYVTVLCDLPGLLVLKAVLGLVRRQMASPVVTS